MSLDHIFDLSCGGGHLLSDSVIRRLLQTGDGDAARLFLYLLSENGRYNEADAEATLQLSPEARREALSVLQQAGLFRELVTPIPTAPSVSKPVAKPASPNRSKVVSPLASTALVTPLVPSAPAPTISAPRSGDPPAYAAGSVAAALSGAPGFRYVVEDVQRRLGRVLSSSDLSILFGMYDWRGMSPGVISLLVAHSLDEIERRHPDGHPPTLKQIDRTAALWQELHIDTEEKAEAYICEKERDRTAIADYVRVLGLSGRRPSATETRHMTQWAEWGFPASAVALAYDRTALQTGSLNWNYMNKILSSWHEKGLRTPEEVERGDAPPARGRRMSGAPARGPRRAQGAVDRLEQYLKEE